MMTARIFGVYERQKRRLIQAYLPSDGVFIDIGANRGDFSLMAARLMGDSGQVVAIEPAPSNLHDLRRTVAVNNLTNIEVLSCALWEGIGTGTLSLSDHSGWHSLTPRADLNPIDQIDVPLTTLDSVIQELSLDRVDVVKIDVEGAEVQVLHGAANILRQYRPVVVMDIDSQRTAADYAEVLQQEGYQVQASGRKDLTAIPR